MILHIDIVICNFICNHCSVHNVNIDEVVIFEVLAMTVYFTCIDCNVKFITGILL